MIENVQIVGISEFSITKIAKWQDRYHNREFKKLGRDAEDNVNQKTDFIFYLRMSRYS